MFLTPIHLCFQVDREIAKAESVIAKLKKKQQELEEAANKTSSDQNDDDEEEERPKSIAQIVYAENRVSSIKCKFRIVVMYT